PAEAGAGTPSDASEGEIMSQGSVLIVDDDRALLQALPEALRLRLGEVTVETADCAAGALDRIAVRDYDAIVTDIKMPGMDGLEASVDERTRERGQTNTVRERPLSLLEGSRGQMEKVIQQIKQVADSPLTVLVQGETGTGKELVARAIHQLSARRDKPFVAVDCGAIPDTLIESELFGYEKGAFTGAHQRKEGQFQRAEGGSL